MQMDEVTEIEKSLRILLVEDTQRDADLVQRELRRDGIRFEAHRVQTGDDLVRELGDFHPDIVLSDYQMPGFDGLAALRLTQQYAAGTPFIIVTGSLSEETAAECIKSGADDYVLKDRRMRLPAAVRAALHKADLERHKHEAEEAVRLSAREWRTTFDAMGDLICLIGPGLTVMRCNRAFREFVGKPWDDILGQKCCDLLDHGNAENCPARQMMERREAVSMEMQIQQRWFHIGVDPLFSDSGVLLGGIHVMTDITQRMDSDQALRRSEAMLAEAQQLAHLGSWTAGLDTHIAVWSNEQYRIWGYEPGTVVPSLWFLMKSIHRNDRSEMARKIRKLKSGAEALDAEYRIVRPDGTIRIVRSQGMRQCDANGKPIRLVGSAMDVTAQREAERERERLQEWQRGVSEIQQALLASASLEERLNAAAEGVVRVFDADYCRIWLIGPGDQCKTGCVHADEREDAAPCVARAQCLHLLASAGRYTMADGNGYRRVPFGSYKVGKLASGAEARFVTNDVQNDPEPRNRAWAKMLGLVSFAGYQLRVQGGETLGVMALYAKHPICAAEETTLENLAGAVALAIRQALAEKKARESGQRYRTLFEASTDAVFVYLVGDDGRSLVITEANDTACRLYGYTREELLRINPANLVAPESREILAEFLVQLKKSGRGHAEWVDMAKDGRRIPVDVSLTEFVADGQHIGMAMVRDITERKEAQRLLQKQLLFVQSLLDTLPTPVFHKDREGRYTLCNRAFEEFQGHSSSELLGKTATDILPPALAKEQLRMDQDLRRTGQPVREESSIDMPGVPSRRIVVHKALLREQDGQPAGILGVLVDITNLKEAQDALQESREKFRSMVDNVGIGVTLIDPNMRILELNAQMRCWFPEAQVGGPVQCYAMFNNPPRACPCTYCPTIRTLADGQVHEAVSETPTGEKVRNYRLVSSPIRDASGRVTAAIEMVEDITERITLEAQFRQAQKMEAVGQLAGGVAHDFNNILTGIMGYTRMLLDDTPKESEAYGDLAEVLELSNRAANLTRQLLAFSRRQTLQPRVLDLNAVVADMTKMLRRLIGEDIDLKFVQASQIQKIKADPGQVEQVVMNLAVNARDAMQGGGQLTIETANVTLDENYVKTHLDARPGEYVMLAVTDTGCGMSKETLQHIFEPFFTTKEVGKGTGLGLATTFGIVKQHNGSIQVYSEVGRGTTFRVYLPATTESANGNGTNGKAAAKGGSETILVVEDETAVREIARRILTQHGYRVLTAESGAEAEEVFTAYDGKIDLLLTDVIMPAGGGQALSERLVERKPSLRVLFMSGYSDSAVFRHGVLKQGSAFIGKPFSQEDLLAAVRSILETKGGGSAK